MKNGMLSRHRWIKRILIGMLCVTVFTVGWFAVVRFISPWTVIQTFTLKSEISNSASSESFSQLRVGCYNIAHGRGGRLRTSNWNGGSNNKKKIRIKEIAQLLRDQQLDIVVLNEVDFSSFWNGHINQAEFIAKEAGYPYRVEQRNVDVAIPFVSLRFGNAILSKYPISNAVFLDFPHPSAFEEVMYGGLKKGVAATVTLPDGSQIQVVAVHLSLEGEAFRVSSVRKILQLQQQSALPMVAMGDFNSTAADLPYYHTAPDGQNCIDTLLANPQLTTILPKQPANPKDFTFPSESPIKAIDWIFISPDWQMKEKTVISTDLSDHLPVTAVLTKAIKGVR